MLAEAQAAPEKVSKRVHHGPEFRVTRTDRHCECRVWLDSTQLCFRSANLKSFPLSAESGPQREVPELKDRCCQKQRGAVSWGPSPAQEAAMGAGGGEVVISQTAPSESPVSGTGQPGRPYGEGAFWACQWVPGGWVKLGVIWLQRKFQGGP